MRDGSRLKAHDLFRLEDRCLDAEAVDTVMAIHRATFIRLVENNLGAVMIEFLEDAAATYSSLAQRLRETRRL